MIMGINLLALIHFSACIWIMIGRYEPSSRNNWICIKGLESERNQIIYSTAIYFTTTTILTVGYGDVAATNIPE